MGPYYSLPETLSGPNSFPLVLFPNAVKYMPEIVQSLDFEGFWILEYSPRLQQLNN